MKKIAVEDANEAPSKVPTTETQQDNQAPSKVPKKQGSRPKNRWKVAFWALMLLIWVFVSVVASELVVGIVMRAILGMALTQTVWSGVYSIISYGLALFLILWVPPRLAKKWGIKREKAGKKISQTLIREQKISREELGLRDYLTWTDIGLSVVGFVVATVLAAGLVQLFSVFPWFDATETQNTGFSLYLSGGERVVAFLILVVLAPILEEVIFRGWLYGKLRSKLSAPISILLTSALFALMHFQWNVSVNVFALSVVLCVMREITGTIYAGILTHMIKNGVAFYLLYVLNI